MDQPNTEEQLDILKLESGQHDFSQPCMFALSFNLQPSEKDKIFHQPNKSCQICVFSYVDGVERVLGTCDLTRKQLYPKNSNGTIYFTSRVMVSTLPNEIQTLKICVEPLTTLIGSEFRYGSQEGLISTAEVSMSMLVRKMATGTQLVLDPSESILTIYCSEVPLQDQNIVMQLHASSISNKGGVLGKTNPYVVINVETNEDGTSYFPVFSTSYIRSCSDAHWPEFCISMIQLCGGNVKQPLRVEGWHYIDGKSDKFIGMSRTTLEKLLLAEADSLILELVNPSKLGVKKGYMCSGKLHVEKISIEPRYTLPEYLCSALNPIQFNLMTIIDFSMHSKQNIKNIHQIYPKDDVTDNESHTMCYNAIKQVCDLVMQYLQPPHIQLLQSGSFAGHPSLYSLNNDDGIKEFVYSVDDVLKEYEERRKRPLKGHMHLSDILTSVNEKAQSILKATSSQEYLVVALFSQHAELFSTEVAPQIADKFLQLSTLPVSFIHIGVGHGTFAPYANLSNRMWGIPSSYTKPIRELHSFVPFEPLQDDRERLAHHLLSRLPSQITEYMRIAHKSPM